MGVCKACPRTDGFYADSRGPKSSLMIVGPFPSVNDVLQNQCFIGTAGRVLAASLLDAGLSPKEVRFSNVINCLPEGGVSKEVTIRGVKCGQGARISKGQRAGCSSRLEEELKFCNPKVVLALGDSSFEALSGIKLGGWGNQYASWVGHPVEPGKSPAGRPFWIIPAFHPNFVVFSGMKLLPVLMQNVRQAAKILQTGKLVLETVQAGSEAKIRKATGPIAFDIETSGSDEITWIGVARGDVTYSAMFSPKLYQLVFELLGEEESVKVAHNAPFDILRLRKIGIKVNGPIWDTMWAHQLFSPDLPKSLSMCTGLLFDVAHWKHLAKADMEFYNRMDTGMTLKLYHKLREKLAADGLLTLFEGSVMPALKTLINMTETGIRVDLKKQEQWAAGLELRKLAARDILGSVNPASPMQLQDLLYKQLGLKPKFAFKSTKITTDSEALHKLRKEVKDGTRESEVLDALRDYRKSSKLLSTYSKQPAVVHPSYFPSSKDDDRGGAATGRLSCQDPNIQNQPKEARIIFVPHERSSGRLVEADYSQIELRVALALSGEKELLALMSSGRDIHSENSKNLGISRKLAKNLAYGAIYGAGVKQLQRTLKADGMDLSLIELSALMNHFKDMMPRLWTWRDKVVKQAGVLGYSQNPFGRRRYFGDMQPPEIINFYPQSIVADIVLERLPKVEQLTVKHGGFMLATVHDSFVIEVSKWKLRAFLPELKQLLEAPIDVVSPGLIIPVDLKVGRRWGRMHKINLDGMKK